LIEKGSPVPAILELAGLRKAFGGIAALDGVALSIERPGLYGLIGPNGAGKTTLFDVICGRQMPDDGAVRFEGRSIEALRVHSRARLGFARTFQECRVLLEESCLDNVLFAAQDKRLGRELRQTATRLSAGRDPAIAEARHLLALVNLDDYANAPAAVLSYGQRRLLEIVSALMSRPRILLLDEPASGVNPTLLNTLRDFLRRIDADKQLVILIVEHNMEFIMSLAAQIVVMHQGQVLAQGTPSEVQSNRDVIEAYLG
jgi:ABC-type branched-subunit amino acid transport system ATPase component